MTRALRTQPTRPVTRPGPKSSVAARRLIKAALKRHKDNQRASARALRLPNHAQMMRMLRGEIGDTPAMRAAIERAETRAKRAYYLVHESDAPTVDVELLCQAVERVERELNTLKELLRCQP